MRTALICHHDSALDRHGVASWLDSSSDLCAIIQIRDGSKALKRRLRREWKRSGAVGMADVLAFRAFYRLAHANKDRELEQSMLNKLLVQYPRHAENTPVLEVEDPNCREVRDFLAAAQPDVVLARCKHLLRESIFSIPRHGTYVLHPGICPQYRNAHGCFWALSEGDLSNLGSTILRIDKGIDTGPVYAHYRIRTRTPKESHVILQHRSVVENLDPAMKALEEICVGTRKPIDTSADKSAVWGQPKLSAYIRTQKKCHSASLSPPTLMYHDVVSGDVEWGMTGFSGASAADYKISEQDFKIHLEELSSILPSPASLVTDLSMLSPSDVPNQWMLTFDDGGKSAISTSAPLLNALGWRAHFFVTTSRINTSGFLSASEIIKLASQGHVVGAHSHTHPLRFAELPQAAMEEEWKRSCGEIESILGVPTVVASVPGGLYSRKVAEAAARAGIRWLFTSDPTIVTSNVDGCKIIGRFTVRRHTKASRVTKLVTGSSLARLEESLRWKFKGTLKEIGGDSYLKIRERIFEMKKK